MATTLKYLTQLQAIRDGYWATESNLLVSRERREVAEVLGLALDLAIDTTLHTSPKHLARDIGRLRRAVKRATV